MRPTASGVTGTLLRLAAGLLTLVGLGAALVVVSADRSDAADLSRFDPGYIISDAVFFNAGAMNAAQIQSFLDVKGAACVPAAGNTCLKNYSENTATRAATTRCAQYNGGAGESAATIISKVASACGINPRVLIVTLQKEQGLVTASTGKPASTYQKAMGYGCPDTAACDSLYYGFFNQVYSAASQFQNYAQNPTKYAHRVGTVAVRYHPNLACGSSAVTIRNQATAGLYNYTPYQPNPAALAAGYGVGDACSSYGNRNFWNYFSDWFGSPTGGSPFGFVDSVDVLGQTVTVTGWAIDPDTNASIAVEASVAGTSVRATASGSRPDVDAAYGRGALHGYSVAITAPPGAQSVCITALDDVGAASPTVLGCRSVVVPHPVAAILDSVTTDVTGITLTGWAFDPDSFSTSVPVVVTVDGSPTTVSANTSRPDIDQIFGSGPNHGFSTHVPAGLGDHQVCVTAKKPAPGVDRSLGCRTVTVRNQDPTGFVDTLTGTPTGI
ncbi:hypothetical protein ACTHAM_001638, partial [Cellulomonas soli]